MNYRFEISLPNSSDFRCEIAMGGKQTFQQFHDKIIEVLGYDGSQMASFYTLDRMGNRVKEIALMDMSTEDEETDTLVMDVTEIQEIVNANCIELEYVFDFFNNRYFRVEYAGEYIADSADVLPVCIYCDGDIPEQMEFEGDENGDSTNRKKSMTIVLWKSFPTIRTIIATRMTSSVVMMMSLKMKGDTTTGMKV